jgi:hypothetical protein
MSRVLPLCQTAGLHYIVTEIVQNVNVDISDLIHETALYRNGGWQTDANQRHATERFFDKLLKMFQCDKAKSKKSKAIPVTGRGGL